jgi:hypothetical protein
VRERKKIEILNEYLLGSEVSSPYAGFVIRLETANRCSKRFVVLGAELKVEVESVTETEILTQSLDRFPGRRHRSSVSLLQASAEKKRVFGASERNIEGIYVL